MYPLSMKQALTLNAFPERLNAANPASVVAVSAIAVFPSPSSSASPDPLEDIRVRAETVSTLLKEIMDRGAMRHWGINE
jgi:hypothetical protein